jgi:hypothetical protein
MLKPRDRPKTGSARKFERLALPMRERASAADPNDCGVAGYAAGLLCAPLLPSLRRSPHQLIEREPMVVDRAYSPEGPRVNQSIATLSLPTALFVSAITSRTIPSANAASRDAAYAHIFAKPTPAEGLIPSVANWWGPKIIPLPPTASKFRTSHIRVAR